jgi:hypothetical protein
MWGRAGAVIDTTTGNIFVATGNAAMGRPDELGRRGPRPRCERVTLVANYTPTNTETLNSTDADLGSTSP